MSIKDSLSGSIGKLLRPSGDGAKPPGGEVDADAVTARIARKHREQTAIDEPLASTLMELWRQVHARVANDPEAALDATRMAEHRERLAQLAPGEMPDLDTCRGMLAVLATVAPDRIDALAARVRELAQGTRDYQRKVGQSELTSSHLRDELDRCRTLIDQEFARRNLPHVAADPLDLHTRLARLPEHEMAPGAAMGLPDPIIGVLEKLIVSNDADALRTLPEWVKRPAARILDLVAERNRYRRLLEHAGMLPTPPRP